MEMETQEILNTLEIARVQNGFVVQRSTGSALTAYILAKAMVFEEFSSLVLYLRKYYGIKDNMDISKLTSDPERRKP